MVSWFLGFLVSRFLFIGFKVLKFQSFKDSKTQGFNDPTLPKLHSMFLEDIDPISKIFKNVLDGLLGLFDPRLFQNVQTSRLPKFRDFQKQYV